MASQGHIQTEYKKQKMVAKTAAKRKLLKEAVRDVSLTLEKRLAASIKLSSYPRNCSKTRLRNRCYQTGRPRGYMRMFGLSRYCVKEQIGMGYLPGVKGL